MIVSYVCAAEPSTRTDWRDDFLSKCGEEMAKWWATLSKWQLYINYGFIKTSMIKLCVLSTPYTGVRIWTHARVCLWNLCLLLSPAGHLVILIKVVQMFIFLDAFSQVLLKCLHVSSMASKKWNVLEVSVQFKCTGTCAQTLERETQSWTQRLSADSHPAWTLL